MTHDIDTLDAIIADLSGSLKIAEEVRNAQEREIGRLVTKVMELEREIRLPCGHVKRVRELETERDALEAEVVKLKDWNYGLRARCEVAEAEVERIKGDRAGWAARSKEQFDRIGVALERVREHRESGEPARDDATEVESLVENVIHLEIESGHWIMRSTDLEAEVYGLTDELNDLKMRYDVDAAAMRLPSHTQQQERAAVQRALAGREGAMTNEKTIEDILKELVAAQKEANETNRALLKHIVDRDAENYVHRLSSALVSMRFVRDEYNLLVEDLRKDIDNENMKGVVDDLGALFGTLAGAVSIGRGNISLTPSDVLVERFKKEKAGETRTAQLVSQVETFIEGFKEEKDEETKKYDRS